MSLVKETFLVDLISNLWIITIFITLFIFLPLKTSYIADNKIIYSHFLVGAWLRIMFIVITGVLGLSYIHLLNWLTLTLLYIIYLRFNYLESHNWQVRDISQTVQNKLLNLIDILDRGLSFKAVAKNILHKLQRTKQIFTNYFEYLITQQEIIWVTILTLILGFAILLRWQYPLSELRFTHPDRYGVLLHTRQILTGNSLNTSLLPVFPAWAATISLLGSIDSMQVIRFLGPILGIILVLSVGYLVKVLTSRTASALVAMLSLGVYIFTWSGKIVHDLPEWLAHIISILNLSLLRQWSGDELELGAIFLLLSLGYYFDSDRQQQKTNSFKINCLAGVVLLAMTSPPLLIILLFAAMVAIGGKRIVLTAIALSWIVLAIFAAMAQGQLVWTQSFLLTLPIALSLFMGILFNQITQIIKILLKKFTEPFCLALVLSLSFNFLLPQSPNLTYVEYDMAARKSLELKNLFPSRSWTLVAPVEQLSQIYGSGWYEDLALFVEKYADQVSNPEFNFPISGEHLFVLVEKIPFVTFPEESPILPNSVLSDRTYQYYRSTSGRASLEFEARKMCETYLTQHPNSQVYYEDEELKIFHFRA